MFTFLRWWLILILIVLSGIGALYTGIFSSTINTGYLGASICFTILAILFLFSLWCGKLCWQLKRKNIDIISRHSEIGWFASDSVFTLGMIGTVVGFIMMLSAFTLVDITKTHTVQQLLKALGGGMGVALYTTLYGLVAGLLLKIQYFNLQQGLDKEKSHEE